LHGDRWRSGVHGRKRKDEAIEEQGASQNFESRTGVFESGLFGKVHQGKSQVTSVSSGVRAGVPETAFSGNLIVPCC
jgi:hypothetical protein